MRTYAWLPPDQAAPADQRVQDRDFDRRIRTDVAKDLAAKGYRPVESGERPDFLLNDRLASEPASVMRAESGGLGGVWSASWMAGGTADDSDNYDEGTLYIAALEPTSKLIVWVGLAQARLVPTMSFERKKSWSRRRRRPDSRTLPQRLSRRKTRRELLEGSPSCR